MPVAIKTRFHGPSLTRGSRITASTCDSGPRRALTRGYDHALSVEENHAAVARALAEKLEWDGDWHIADGGEVYLFVRVTSWSRMFSVKPREVEANG